MKNFPPKVTALLVDRNEVLALPHLNLLILLKPPAEM